MKKGIENDITKNRKKRKQIKNWKKIQKRNQKRKKLKLRKEMNQS